MNSSKNNILLDKETIFKVTQFSKPDLEVWVRSRFEGHDPFFLDPMKDEFPGTKIAWIYKEYNETDIFRKDIETITTKLLKETLKEANLNKAFQILDMMESGGFERPSDYIKALVESQKYQGQQTIYGDFHEKLLLTLVSMRASFLEPDFWRQQMSDFKYAYVAFLGLFYLLKPDFDALVPDFKKLIAYKIEHPEEIEIDFIIMLFIDYMRKKDLDIIDFVTKHFRENSKEWKILDEEFADFDIHLRPQPSFSNKLLSEAIIHSITNPTSRLIHQSYIR